MICPQQLSHLGCYPWALFQAGWPYLALLPKWNGRITLSYVAFYASLKYAAVLGDRSSTIGPHIKAIIKERHFEHRSITAAKAATIRSQQAQICKLVQEHISKALVKYDKGEDIRIVMVRAEPTIQGDLFAQLRSLGSTLLKIYAAECFALTIIGRATPSTLGLVNDLITSRQGATYETFL
jgi:hypothetical protein